MGKIEDMTLISECINDTCATSMLGSSKSNFVSNHIQALSDVDTIKLENFLQHYSAKITALPEFGTSILKIFLEKELLPIKHLLASKNPEFNIIKFFDDNPLFVEIINISNFEDPDLVKTLFATNNLQLIYLIIEKVRIYEDFRKNENIAIDSLKAIANCDPEIKDKYSQLILKCLLPKNKPTLFRDEGKFKFHLNDKTDFDAWKILLGTEYKESLIEMINTNSNDFTANFIKEHDLMNNITVNGETNNHFDDL